ncbi:MAG: hypothetical protein ABL921_31430, partial [Pirellula sp.]
MYVSSNAKNCTWPWIGKAFSASLLISGLGINMESVCAQTEQVSPVVVNRFQSMLPPSFVGPSNATQIRIAPKPVVQHVESGPIELRFSGIKEIYLEDKKRGELNFELQGSSKLHT